MGIDPAIITRTAREELVEHNRSYADGNQAIYSMAWVRVYKILSVEKRTNIRARARALEISKISYLEQEGLLPDALRIARQILK